ncbi:PIN domain-containing protein [Streptomyces sp. NPDC004100]
MLITPHPGANRNNILDALRRIRRDAHKLRNGDQHDYLFAYLDWIASSARLLHRQVRESDIQALVHTDGHRMIVAGSGYMGEYTATGQQRFLAALIDRELEQRVEDLDIAVETLTAHTRRWGGVETLALADSSFYIHHPTKLEETDFCALLQTQPQCGVRLLAPIVVIDELDRLKEASKKHARWRARHTLAVFDRVLSADGRGTLAPPSGIGKTIALEIVFDPLGHTRLPDADDEIIDRALSVQAVAGRPVTLVTYDTGQAMRARTRGLHVMKLVEPEEGEEPDRSGQDTKPGTGVRAQRRAREAARREGEMSPDTRRADTRSTR